MLATLRRRAAALTRHLSRRANDEHGQVLVLTVLFLTVLLGVGGLVMDAGIATVHRRSAQAAADAAALAGASDLTGQGTTPTAAQVAAAIADGGVFAGNNNFPNGGNITVQVYSPPVGAGSFASGSKCAQRAGATPTHAGDVHSVQVCITQNLNWLFGGVLPGLGALKVQSYAVATAFGASLYTPTVALLDPVLPEALDVGITGAASSLITMTVNGALTVNSANATEAEQCHNNYNFVSATNAVQGMIDPLPTCTIGPSSQHLNAPIPDPLAAVPTPSVTTPLGVGFKCQNPNLPVSMNVCSGGTASACDAVPPALPSCKVNHYNEMVFPGVWKDIWVTDDGSIVMQPGTYIITGQLSLIDGPTGPGHLTGNGVTLFFACPNAASPYWQACAAGGGNGNENGSASGGFMNLTGNNLSTTAGWSPDSNPHQLAGHYNLTAPASGTYHGLLIFYDRNNYNPATLTTENHPTNLGIEGNASDTMTGTIYGAKTRGVFYSIPTGPWNMDSCFVLDTLEMDGLTNININCTPGNNYYDATIPGGSTLTE